MIALNLQKFMPAFTGIRPPYVKNGRNITPIAMNPTEADIKKAIEAEQTAKAAKDVMEGYNGYAFWLGEDLVVKKYKGKDAFSDDPSREINMLDSLFDNGLWFKNSQLGMYAFTDGDSTYLVSTKVDGKEPDSVLSPFTKENLTYLVEIISQMDKGMLSEGSSKNGYSDRVRFMNYDFNGGNIKLTENKAGLFDFEYSILENIDDMIEKTIVRKDTGANCHQSDTSALPSSLRSFEFYTFCPYLNGAKGDVSELFNDYLAIKGCYHKGMYEFFRDFSKESKFEDIVNEISIHELAHSNLLRKNAGGKVPADIVLAEASKIQMSHFMHEQSQFSDTGRINPKQLKEYTDETVNFFKICLKRAESAGDINREVYYRDCLKLFESWQRVNGTLKEKIKRKDPEIMKKLTEDYAPTLDEKVLKVR